MKPTAEDYAAYDEWLRALEPEEHQDCACLVEKPAPRSLWRFAITAAVIVAAGFAAALGVVYAVAWWEWS
jgi:hypothetical protein